MSQLNKEFIEDTLTLEGLDELRAELGRLSDSEIESRMLGTWQETCRDEPDTMTFRQDSMLKKIDNVINKDRRRKRFLTVSGWIGCAVLAVALVFVEANNLRKIWELSEPETTICTADGEKATVTLPDGSRIKINYGSRLTYNQSDFLNGERKVDFSGEGFFDISKKDGIPFIVNSDDLTVKVTGTRFNLRHRNGNISSELALFDGSVSLFSKETGKGIEMSPGQVATFNRSTHIFDLGTPEDIPSQSSWTRDEITFRRASLPRILETLGHYYGCKVTASPRIKNLGKTFSGTLPMNDINEALSILELLFPINTIVLDKTITVSLNDDKDI